MRAVLILGGRAPVALEHARHFAAAGWKVQVADSAPCRLAGWSRAVAGVVTLPPPRPDPLAWAAALAEACTRLRIDLVVPTCEEVFYLSRYRARLPATVRVAADDFATLRSLHSKVDFVGLALGCGVDVPATQRVHTLAEARDWAGGAPLVLKPEYSRFGVHVRLHPHGLPDDAPPLSTAGPWAAQRWLAGDELCSYAIAERGHLLAWAAYRPAWRMPGSASFFFEPVHDARIRAFTTAFVAKTGFSGQIAFDWIAAADGTLAVIECNPRGTSGVHLFAPGDGLPAALAGDVAAATPAFAPSWQRPAMLGPVMATAGAWVAIRERRLAAWWRDLRRARDVLAPAGDRRPLAGALIDLAAYGRLAAAQGISVRAATTRDIEWDGEELPAA